MSRLIGDRHASVLREFRVSPWRTAAQWRHRGAVTVGRGFHLRGGHRIELSPRARLALGTSHHGLIDYRAGGVIRVHGSLRVDGDVTVYSGNAWEIREGASMSVGDGAYFSPSGSVLCHHEVSIGAGCAIGHRTHIMDSDLHRLTEAGDPASGDRPTSAAVRLGERVLVGSHCLILKGVSIAPGCVVAAGSTVTRSVETPGALLAGVPARVVRTGVTWT